MLQSTRVSYYDNLQSNIIEVFFSHDWGEEENGMYPNHEKVKDIKKRTEGYSKSYRLVGWLDEERLRGGDKLTPKIKAAIKNCDIFLFFVTENYQNKYTSGANGSKIDYCYLELQTAINLNKTTIPIILEASMKMSLNWKPEFGSVLSDVVYRDFSSPQLFMEENEVLLQKNCETLISDILRKNRENQSLVNPSSALSTISSTRVVNQATSPLQVFFRSRQFGHSYYRVPSSYINSTSTTIGADQDKYVMSRICPSHDNCEFKHVCTVCHQLKCNDCQDDPSSHRCHKISIKDYIATTLLPQIRKINPQHFIEKQFSLSDLFLQQFLQNIETIKKNTEKEIDIFYYKVCCFCGIICASLCCFSSIILLSSFFFLSIDY
jgi:hypothetical protein